VGIDRSCLVIELYLRAYVINRDVTVLPVIAILAKYGTV